jgi:hypothetical protein
MDNATLAQSLSVAYVDRNTWRIGAVGDYNNDARNDIVWRHAANGQIVIWWGTGQATFPTWLTLPGNPDLSWQITGPR